MLWHMKLKLREGFGCHWPSSPQFLSPTLSSETCQVFARKCLRSSFLIQTLEILHLLVDIVASAYLLGGKKFRLLYNKKLRHALLSRPTAPGPHIPPARADKYVFQTELFSWHALLSPLASPPCWLRPGRVCYWSPHLARPQDNKEIGFDWKSRFVSIGLQDLQPTSFETEGRSLKTNFLRSELRPSSSFCYRQKLSSITFCNFPSLCYCRSHFVIFQGRWSATAAAGLSLTCDSRSVLVLTTD